MGTLEDLKELLHQFISRISDALKERSKGKVPPEEILSGFIYRF